MKYTRKKEHLPMRRILKIYSLPDTWFRLEHVSKVANGLDITFGVYQGKHGKKVDAWKVICRQVYEAKITPLDGGGIRLYSAHPAGQQYTGRSAQLFWNGEDANDSEIIGAIYQAHTREAGDWIPFDRYTDFKTSKGEKTVWKGPAFLLRAYARALRDIGIKALLKTSIKRNTKPALKVLHFGESHVVAAIFKAQHIKPTSDY